MRRATMSQGDTRAEARTLGTDARPAQDQAWLPRRIRAATAMMTRITATGCDSRVYMSSLLLPSLVWSESGNCRPGNV
jgi:hypothetical protein